MSAIDDAMPEAGKADLSKLRAIDPETLARYVIDVAHSWWQRLKCAEALRDRVPAAFFEGLFERIRDPEDIIEVRCALMSVLGDRVELLPWLQEQGPDNHFGVYERVLETRAGLADLTAAPGLVGLAASPWPLKQEAGERGLDKLIALRGTAAVEAVVGHDTPEARTFVNRLRSREHADLTSALADPDVGVARRAAELIVDLGSPDNDHLLDHVVTGPTIEARLWAVYILHRRGRDIRDLWQALDTPRVEVPGLPDDIRLAIIRQYAGETYCDPRWLLEEICVPLPEQPDEAAQLELVRTALIDAGITPGYPLTAEQVNGAGEGTFHQIDVGRTVVLISTLGAFATADDEASGVDRARQALEAAGFRWIDDELGTIVVTGLPVYYFGHRDPLGVRTLLFYWQD